MRTHCWVLSLLWGLLWVGVIEVTDCCYCCCWQSSLLSLAGLLLSLLGGGRWCTLSQNSWIKAAKTLLILFWLTVCSIFCFFVSVKRHRIIYLICCFFGYTIVCFLGVHQICFPILSHCHWVVKHQNRVFEWWVYCDYLALMHHQLMYLQQ